MEQERIITDTIGFSGTGNISLLYIKNNKEFWSESVHLHTQFKTNRSLYLCILDYSLQKAKDASQETTNSFYSNAGVAHVRYNYKTSNWLTLEAFSQAQFNRVMDVKLRWLTGVGPRFKMIALKNFRIYTAALYAYEYENLESGHILRDHRISSYVSFSLKLRDNLGISSTTYWQPKIKNFSDFRISSQTDLSIKISSRFSFKMSYLYCFDSAPPSKGISKETSQIKNSIEYSFGK